MIPTTKSSQAGLALALAFFSGMLSSSLPTPLYPVYVSLYRFSASQIMAVFGVYAAGVLLALLFTAKVNVRPEAYTRPVYTGLGCVLISSLLMMFADNITLLLIARLITGLGSGILMAYINRSLIKIFATEVSNHAALIASAALILGQAIGPFITGNIVQHNFYSLKAPFIILLVLVLLSLFAIWRCREWVNKPIQPVAEPQQNLTLHRHRPLTLRDVYLCCMAIFLSWAMASTLMSQGPTLAHNGYAIGSVQIVSYCLSLFLLTAGITQWLMRKRHHYSSLKIGVSTQLAAILLALVSVQLISPALVLVAVIAEGFAYGAILVGAATIVNQVVRQKQRTHLINLLYITGYVGNWLPFALSIMMDHYPLLKALSDYLIVCSLLAFCIALAAQVSARKLYQSPMV